MSEQPPEQPTGVSTRPDLPVNYEVSGGINISNNPSFEQNVHVGDSQAEIPSQPLERREIPVAVAEPEPQAVEPAPETPSEPAPETPIPPTPENEQPSEVEQLKQELSELREQLKRQQDEQTKAMRSLTKELRENNRLMRQLLEQNQQPQPAEPEPAPEPEPQAEPEPEPVPTEPAAETDETGETPAGGDITPPAEGDDEQTRGQKIRNKLKAIRNGMYAGPAVVAGWMWGRKDKFEDDPNLSEEEKEKRRRRRRLGLAAGALLLGAGTALLLSRGLPGFGDGGDGGVGPEAIPPGPDQTPGPENGGGWHTESLEPYDAGGGSYNYYDAGTIWDHTINDLQEQVGSKPTDAQIQRATQFVLDHNNVNWDQAHSLPVGFKFKVPNQFPDWVINGR